MTSDAISFRVSTGWIGFDEFIEPDFSACFFDFLSHSPAKVPSLAKGFAEFGKTFLLPLRANPILFC